MIFLKQDYIYEELTSLCGVTFSKTKGINPPRSRNIDRLLQQGILYKMEEEVEVVNKAQCEKCGGYNIHYKEGCLDCKKEEDEAEIEEEKLESKLSSKEIFKLIKKEQVKLIEELGGDEIPRYEKDRVKLILKLQKMRSK